MNKKNKSKSNNRTASKTRLIAAFHEMEAAGSLPLFENDSREIPEMELASPLEIDKVDMGMIRVVDVALSMSNCVRTLNIAKKSVRAAFPNAESVVTPIMTHLEVALTEVLAGQADAMNEVTKRAKAYNKNTKSREPKTQKYEKTYSKTKVVG